MYVMFFFFKLQAFNISYLATLCSDIIKAFNGFLGIGLDCFNSLLFFPRPVKYFWYRAWRVRNWFSRASFPLRHLEDLRPRHRTTPKKRHLISNNLSAYLWFKLIEAPPGVLAKESEIVLTKFHQRCICVISGISMRIFLCFCFAIYFLWRSSDGADVPVNEILSDAFISLSADSLGIFFGSPHGETLPAVLKLGTLLSFPLNPNIVFLAHQNWNVK